MHRYVREVSKTDGRGNSTARAPRTHGANGAPAPGRPGRMIQAAPVYSFSESLALSLAYAAAPSCKPAHGGESAGSAAAALYVCRRRPCPQQTVTHPLLLEHALRGLAAPLGAQHLHQVVLQEGGANNGGLDAWVRDWPDVQQGGAVSALPAFHIRQGTSSTCLGALLQEGHLRLQAINNATKHKCSSGEQRSRRGSPATDTCLSRSHATQTRSPHSCWHQSW